MKTPRRRPRERREPEPADPCAVDVGPVAEERERTGDGREDRRQDEHLQLVPRAANARRARGQALARDAGLSLRLQLLFYPGCAARQEAPSHQRYGQGLVLEQAHIEYFFGHYIAEADRDDWRFAPLNTPDLEGVAPAWFIGRMWRQWAGTAGWSSRMNRVKASASGWPSAARSRAPVTAGTPPATRSTSACAPGVNEVVSAFRSRRIVYGTRSPRT